MPKTIASKVRHAAIGALAVLLLAPGGAWADEIEDTLSAALEAYRAGDVGLAKEELDYAATLLGQLKAEGLQGFLPPAPSGWTRRDGDGVQAMAAFGGGGVVATAEYTKGSEFIELTMMADNQLVASMGAMLANTGMMAQFGKVRRVGRQTYVVTQDGEVQALVGGRVMVQLGGDAPVETMVELFEAIDHKALADF